MKAYLKHYRQSPRKVRLVADAIRGKSVKEARTMLKFLDNKSAGALGKLIDSAVANAQNKGENVDSLIIGKITVDLGFTMKRYMPMARGRATGIRKRTSRVAIELTPAPEKKEKKGAAKKTAVKKTAKKAAKKVAKKEEN